MRIKNERCNLVECDDGLSGGAAVYGGGEPSRALDSDTRGTLDREVRGMEWFGSSIWTASTSTLVEGKMGGRPSRMTAASQVYDSAAKAEGADIVAQSEKGVVSWALFQQPSCLRLEG